MIGVAARQAPGLWSRAVTNAPNTPAAEPLPDQAADVVSERPYRPCVGIALFNRQGRVFLGRRRGAGPVGAWQMPQGGIDAGEAPYDAALRELHEETNIRARSVTRLGECDGWLSYDLPPDVTKRVWKDRYRGQTQKWFALGFLGEDDEIDIEQPGGGGHKPEFDAWRWDDLAVAPGLIVPFKRPVYERVAAAFAGLSAWRG